MSLRRQALDAMFWVAVATYSAKLLSVVTSLLLARLLVPQSFGLVAAASVILNALQIFQTIGLRQALIVRIEINEDVLNTAFFMSSAMGGILAILLCLAAPLISLGFDNYALTPVLRVLSITLAISSIGTVPSALMEKGLSFRKLALPSVLGTFAYGIVAIPLALLGLEVWSIVWGNVARSAVSTIAVTLAANWRAKLRFDRSIAAEMFAYGKYIVGASFGAFLLRNVDTIMVGRILGMSLLGNYDLAFSLANSLPALLINIISPVMLPTYSRIQHDRDRLTNLYLRLLKYTIVIFVPIALIEVFFGRDIVLTLYGAKWVRAVLPFQILSVYAIIRQVTATNASIFMLTGMVKEMNMVSYFNLGLLIVLGFPALWFMGLEGMSIAMVASASVCCYLTFSLNRRTLGTRLASHLALTFVPLTAALASAFVIVVLNSLSWLPAQIGGLPGAISALLILAARIVIALVVYAGVVIARDPEVRADVLHVLPGVKSRIVSVLQKR